MATIGLKKLAGLLTVGLLSAGTNAHALIIQSVFDSSITSNANATTIEGSINSAINAIEGLFSNAVTLKVNFTFDAAAAGNLLSTNQYYRSVTYNQYVTALTADSTAHPENLALKTALANLQYGNDANGQTQLAVADGLYQMLGFGTPSDPIPVVNINSTRSWDFSQPASTKYDLIGGLEHELDEVLGGGGSGSTLGSSNSFFNTRYGVLDLYRYSATDVASFQTTASSSYFSIDGGADKIIGFNQTSGGDYGDFGPQCGTNAGGGQYVQKRVQLHRPLRSLHCWHSGVHDA